MSIRYKVGDEVVLTSVRPERWASSGAMDKYLGRTMAIEGIGNPSVVFIDRESQRWNFRITDIIGFADKEKEAARVLEIKKEIAKNIEKAEFICSIAKEVFPEERLDFTPLSEEGRFDIIIHFPEIKITNSLEHEHVIKDIFVKFNISCIDERDDDSKYIIHFFGARTTLSLKEFISTYGHSHLPNHSLCTFNGFCLGSSDFGTLIQTVQFDPTPENWYLLFFSVENYLNWESLEGGPYRRMSQMSYNINNDFAGAQNELFRLLPNIPSEVFSFNEGVVLNTNHPSLYNYYSQHSKIRNAGINNFRLREILKRKQIEVAGSYLKFKGMDVPARLYNENLVQEEKDDTSTITADVVNYFNNLLKQEINKFNLSYGYETAKNLRHQTVFGEVGAF